MPYPSGKTEHPHAPNQPRRLMGLGMTLLIQ